MTTLAWVVFAMFCAPLDGRRTGRVSPGRPEYWPALFSQARCMASARAMQDTQPRCPTDLAGCHGYRPKRCAILFCEIIFRGMNVLVPPSQGKSRARPSRRHRPQDYRRLGDGSFSLQGVDPESASSPVSGVPVAILLGIFAGATCFRCPKA